jgi:c-di-GMP-binding flagellar brake protein YcgR
MLNHPIFAIILRVQTVAKERRRFFRHPIHVPIKLRATSKGESFAAQTRDLSLGGLNFIWPKRLARGTSLNITIPVKDKLFELQAKVVYVHEDRKTGRFFIGVSFVDFPSAFKARLAEEVLQILEFRKTVSRELGHEVSEEEAASQWVRDRAAGFPSAG